MSYKPRVFEMGTVVFRPGAPSAQPFVATWAEVQAVLATSAGCCVVYVDDSLAPCNVPGSSGVTDFKGRGEIRPYRSDGTNFSTLVVDNGATLKSVARISGTVWVRFDTQGVVQGLDFDYTPNVVGTPSPYLVVEDFGSIGMTSTSTFPAHVVPANGALVLQFNLQGGTFDDPAGASIFNLVNVTSSVVVNSFGGELRDVTGLLLVPSKWISGPGDATFNYDATTIAYSGGLPRTNAAVTFTHCNDSFDRSMELNATTLDVFGSSIAAGELAQVGSVTVHAEGFGGSGGAGGGTGGAGGSAGAGGPGSGGCRYQCASFDHDLTHPLDVHIGAGGLGGTGGLAGGGVGQNGANGGPSYCQDATTMLILASFVGSGGGDATGVNGGATWPALGIKTVEPGSGGLGGTPGSNGAPGQIAALSKNNNLVPGATWLGGAGGANGGAGGGGGGGAGPYASGAVGGTAKANGGNATANTGNGAGGGGGGLIITDPGGSGGNGQLGRIRLTWVAPSGIPG